LVGGFCVALKMSEGLGYTYPSTRSFFMADTKSDKHTANGVEGAILALGFL